MKLLIAISILFISGVAAAQTYTISGTVTGTCAVGTTVSLTGNLIPPAFFNYPFPFTFTNLPAGGSYTLTPSQATSTYSPANITISPLTSNVTGQNFVCAPAAGTLTISGTVTTGSGAPLQGVNIACSGPAGTTNIPTDANGNWSCLNQPPGGYNIGPLLLGYTFAPATINLLSVTTNLTGQNFVASLIAYSIPITIMGPVVSGVLGTAVNPSTGVVRTCTTVATGSCDIPVDVGAFTVTPSLAGFTFTPPNTAVTVSTANAPIQVFQSVSTITAVPAVLVTGHMGPTAAGAVAPLSSPKRQQPVATPRKPKQ